MAEISLESLLNKFCVHKKDNIWIVKEAYENEMTHLLDRLLKQKKWALEDCLLLAIGLLFWPYLMKKCREKKRKLEENIYQTIESLLDLYAKKENILKSGIDKDEIIKNPQPLRWMELFEKYEIEINQKICQKILLAHFDLDWRIAENSKHRGITFNEDQAAAFLSDTLGWNVSPKNVLELCLEQLPYGFGAYLDYIKYCHSQNEFSIMSASCIQEAIDSGVIDTSYLYSYEGLMRLVTENKQDAFDDFLSSQTVKHIRDGGIIELSANRPILCVQLSLSDLILGKSQFLSIKQRKDLFMITSKNLLYREEELRIFAIEYKKQFCNIVDSASQEQLLSRPAIKKIYSNVTIHQWDKFFANEDNNGLANAKISGQSARQDRYYQNKLHNWLIENGHYMPKELLKLLQDTQAVTHQHNIASIILND